MAIAARRTASFGVLFGPADHLRVTVCHARVRRARHGRVRALASAAIAPYLRSGARKRTKTPTTVTV
jgi:hypothetical protein